MAKQNDNILVPALVIGGAFFAFNLFKKQQAKANLPAGPGAPAQAAAAPSPATNQPTAQAKANLPAGPGAPAQAAAAPSPATNQPTAQANTTNAQQNTPAAETNTTNTTAQSTPVTPAPGYPIKYMGQYNADVVELQYQLGFTPEHQTGIIDLETLKALNQYDKTDGVWDDSLYIPNHAAVQAIINQITI